MTTAYEHADGCDLCEAARITPWFHEDDICWIAECEICAVPMVVWRGHGVEPPAGELAHMHEQLAGVVARTLRVRALRRRQHAEHPGPLPRARAPGRWLLRPRPEAPHTGPNRDRAHPHDRSRHVRSEGRDLHRRRHVRGRRRAPVELLLSDGRRRRATARRLVAGTIADASDASSDAARCRSTRSSASRSRRSGRAPWRSIAPAAAAERDHLDGFARRERGARARRRCGTRAGIRPAQAADVGSASPAARRRGRARTRSRTSCGCNSRARNRARHLEVPGAEGLVELRAHRCRRGDVRLDHVHWLTDNRDLRNVDYDPALLAIAGIDRAQLPNLLPATSVIGTARASAGGRPRRRRRHPGRRRNARCAVGRHRLGCGARLRRAPLRRHVVVDHLSRAVQEDRSPARHRDASVAAAGQVLRRRRAGVGRRVCELAPGQRALPRRRVAGDARSRRRVRPHRRRSRRRVPAGAPA